MVCVKTPFTSQTNAKKAAASVARPNGDRRMACYLCPECHRWHLTGAKVGRTV